MLCTAKNLWMLYLNHKNILIKHLRKVLRSISFKFVTMQHNREMEVQKCENKCYLCISQSKWQFNHNFVWATDLRCNNYLGRLWRREVKPGRNKVMLRHLGPVSLFNKVRHQTSWPGSKTEQAPHTLSVLLKAMEKSRFFWACFQESGKHLIIFLGTNGNLIWLSIMLSYCSYIVLI